MGPRAQLAARFRATRSAISSDIFFGAASRAALGAECAHVQGRRLLPVGVHAAVRAACWHVWPRINFVTKMVAGIFVVIMWAAIDTGAWNRNARDVRRETDAMQRQALLDAKMTVGSWASRYLGTPRWSSVRSLHSRKTAGCIRYSTSHTKARSRATCKMLALADAPSSAGYHTPGFDRVAAQELEPEGGRRLADAVLEVLVRDAERRLAAVLAPRIDAHRVGAADQRVDGADDRHREEREPLHLVAVHEQRRRQHRLEAAE